MKKSVIIIAAAAAVLTPASIMAGYDYIELNKLFNQKEKIYIDDVKEITVLKTQGITDGFNTMQVEYKNGLTSQWLMPSITGMNYIKGRQDSQIQVEVEPHHRSVTFHVTSPDPNAHWQVGALPVEYFNGKNIYEYSDAIFDYELDLIYDYLSKAGGQMQNLATDFLFPYTGDGKVTWFPSTMEEHIAMPGKDYIAYVYQADNNTGFPNFSHEAIWMPFTAKVVNIIDVPYGITYSTTANSITANITSPDNEPYSVFLLEASQVEGMNLESVAMAQISSLENVIYNYGDGDWDNYTYRGSYSGTHTGLCSGDSFYIVVVGNEYGTMTSHAVASEKITIPYPTVTDQCTFEVDAQEITPSEINLSVTPSSNDTNYVVYMTDGGTVNDPLQYFTRILYTMNKYSNKLKPGSAYLHSGAKTINSLTEVLEGKPMISGNNYTFYLIGIDENATPTTAIQAFDYTPGTSESSMTFDLNFDLENYDTTSAWGRYLYCDITPSDPNMAYVYDKVKYNESLLAMSDTEFINKYVADQYGYLNTSTGNQREVISFSSWGTWETYLVFVFGFDGSPTSELYLYKFDSGTGELTPLRGPDAQ